MQCNTNSGLITLTLKYFIGQVEILFNKDFQKTFVQVNGTIQQNTKSISSKALNSVALKNRVILNFKHASRRLKAQK